MTSALKSSKLSKPNLWLWTIICLLVTAIIALAFSYQLKAFALPSEHAGMCEQVDSSTLKLSGKIDDGMKTCAMAMLTPDIETVIVRSPGGETIAGRTIAMRIGETPRTLIIDTYCISSCANYFVPAAHKLVLNSGAVIGLHGSPDPKRLVNPEFEAFLEEQAGEGGAVAESARRTLTLKRTQAAQHLREEAQFTELFNVPLGWRLYMDVEDKGRDWLQYFTAGSGADLSEGNILIVEEPMIASCLPHVDISQYQSTLENSVFNKRRYWQGLKDEISAYRSRNLTCQ